MTSAIVKVGNCATIYESTPALDLSTLRASVTALEPAHPLRSVVMSLPKEMPVLEYTTLVPTLWSLAERR